MKNNVMNNNYSFALRAKVAREQQDRNTIKNIIVFAVLATAAGAFLYFAPDAIHGSFAFQDAVVNAYR